MTSWLVGEKRGVSTRSSPRVEVGHVGAVLVHDGEALDPLLLGAGLVDEDDAGVEIALLAGEPLIDGVGDDVGDAAPVLRLGEILLADQLLAGEHVPQPELGLHPAVRLAGHAAGDQRLGIDDAPVLEARRGVRIGDLLDEGGRVDRGEQAGAAQVAGDDLGDALAGLGILRAAAALEVGDGDGQRLHRALGDVELQHGLRRAAAEQREATERARTGEHGAAADAGNRQGTGFVDEPGHVQCLETILAVGVSRAPFRADRR